MNRRLQTWLVHVALAVLALVGGTIFLAVR